jgi:hypothetical protein
MRNLDRWGQESASVLTNRLESVRKTCSWSTLSAVKSTSGGRVTSAVGIDRRIPAWASGLIGALARDTPAVVTRDDIARRLEELDNDRDIDATVDELRRLGWFVGLPIHGTWAFIPPGQDTVADDYLPLRAWSASGRDGQFMLAGAAAAWHLGYLDRAPDGRVPVWLPEDKRLPDGLRPYVSVTRIKWPKDACRDLAPNTALLVRRKLDIVTWSGGLPAFGPEALLIQLGARPSSFRPWADFVAHLAQVVDDCDDDRLVALLAGQSTSTWQRTAYLLHAGGRPPRGIRLFDRRPRGPIPKTHFERRLLDRSEEDAPALWVPQYNVVDRLIAPLQRLVGKA